MTRLIVGGIIQLCLVGALFWSIKNDKSQYAMALITVVSATLTTLLQPKKDDN